MELEYLVFEINFSFLLSVKYKLIRCNVESFLLAFLPLGIWEQKLCLKLKFSIHHKSS